MNKDEESKKRDKICSLFYWCCKSYHKYKVRWLYQRRHLLIPRHVLGSHRLLHDLPFHRDQNQDQVNINVFIAGQFLSIPKAIQREIYTNCLINDSIRCCGENLIKKAIELRQLHNFLREYEEKWQIYELDLNELKYFNQLTILIGSVCHTHTDKYVCVYFWNYEFSSCLFIFSIN